MQFQKIALLAVVASAAVVEEETTPVTKVINLMKDLKHKMIVTGEHEDKVYNKFACWCETTSAKKAANIVKNDKDLRSLGQAILKLKGRIQTYASEIADQEGIIKRAEAKKAKQTTLRVNQNAKYMKMEPESKTGIESLERAINTINKATSQMSGSTGGVESKGGVALLDQTNAAEVATTAMSAVQSVLERIPLDAPLNPEHVSLLSEFVSSGDVSKYAPQSATIMGILTDMYTTFTKNLQDAVVKEMQQNTAYEQATDTDDETIAAANTIKSEKEKNKAKAEVDLAATTSTYDSTYDQKKANVKFFDEMKASCNTKHTEYQLRTKLRAEEKKGIEEALEVLTSSSSRASFAKSKSTKAAAAASFFQLDQSEGAEEESTGNADFDRLAAATKREVAADSAAGETVQDAEMKAMSNQMAQQVLGSMDNMAEDNAGWLADKAFFEAQEKKNHPKGKPSFSLGLAQASMQHFLMDPMLKDYATKAKKEADKAQQEQDLRSHKELMKAGAEDSTKAILAEVAQKKKDAIAAEKAKNTPTFKGMKEGEITGAQMAELFQQQKNARNGAAADSGESDANEPNFLQISAESDVEAVTQKAYKVIQSHASKSKSLRLAMLAVHMRTAKAGHFDTVIAEINNMVETLAQEGKDDKKKKDQCKEEFAKIHKKEKNLNWRIKNNWGVIRDDTRVIHNDNVTEIDCWQQVNASAAFRQKITNDRNESHDNWLSERTDDNTAIDLLVLSKAKLTAFYDAQKVDMGAMEAPVLVQASEPVFDRGDAAPDASLSKKDDNKGAKKAIVSLMDYIIEDLKSNIVEATADEAEEVKEWQASIATALELEKGLREKINNLEADIALRDADKTEETGVELSNEDKLAAVKQYEAQIKPDCDWMVANFEGRAKARLAEHDGLIEAIELLSGKTALLQSKKTVEKETNVVDKLRNINFLGMRS